MQSQSSPRTSKQTVLQNLPTVIKSVPEPSFVTDICPYFLASYAFIVSHVIYQLTGNLLVPIWLAYLINLPSIWRKESTPEANLDLASEKAFAKDKRFYLPLYVFVAIDVLNWIWCLCIVAEKNPAEGTALSFVFENRHGDGILNWAIFTFVWGYMAGLAGLAGHELIHKREPFNKMVGIIPFTKILYMHFYLEHSSGHHKHVATEHDPASAQQGHTFYHFLPKAVLGGILSTHEREKERMRSEYSEKSREDLEQEPPLLYVLYEHRLLQYFLVQAF